ncbi:hypothetical protein [Actinomadura livida]|uniref:Uncharacterized protein n=1 Tax=Actinomadura livida TaxID=79909 RepID=A0A7W7IFF6_9ACTN|nr:MULTISPECIES: hypothetical protein [Actinomadura]MBB4776087.1 hypothetical protein [Actinomadura catellatispora]GGU15581.1 hypothetical protein GCM10010208_45750 [Actinomadura livida]
MKLRPGRQLASAVDGTRMVVVRAPAEEVEVTCGGRPMVDAAEAPAPTAADPARQDGTLLGKRYADEALGIELLCTKAGQGTVEVNGAALPVKEAKPLPASD